MKKINSYRPRLAVSKDIPKVIYLLNQLFEMEEGVEFNESLQKKGLEMLISHPNAEIVIVEGDAGAVVGMCTLQMLISTAKGALSGWIEDMVIDKNLRTLGVGTLLLDFTKEHASRSGCVRIQLLCDENNLSGNRFYQKNGFAQLPWYCWTLD